MQTDIHTFKCIHIQAHTHTFGCWCTSRGRGASYVNTHLFHYRTLQAHIAPSKNAPTDSHLYQTRIYIALTAPPKNTHMHSYQLLIALIAHYPYLLSYEHTVLPMYRQAFSLEEFLEPHVSPITPPSWSIYHLVIFINLSADGCPFLYICLLYKTLTRHRYISMATFSLHPNSIFLAMDA